MKCVIAFSCLLAVASAGFIGNAAPLAYSNVGSTAVAYNAPLVNAPHPVPVGPYFGPLAHGYAGPIAAPLAAPALAYAGYAHAAPLGLGLASEARLVDPVAIAAGAPLPTGDTVEVAAAKAAHFQAHAAAKGLAVAAPLAAPAVAYAGYAHAAPLALASEARLVDPVAIAAGAPLPTGDTVEVAAAKAAHFQAHVAAKSALLGRKKRSPGFLNAGVVAAAPLAYAAPVASYGYSALAAPLAYTGYGYGGHLSAYYG